EVARGRARRDLEAELERLRQRHRRDAVLERIGRVHGVVLDPDVAQTELRTQPVGAHEGREPGAEVDGVAPLAGEQVRVTPDRRRPRGDALTARGPGDRGVVVGDLERAEAPLARVHGGDVVLAAALPTAKTLHVCHGDLLTGRHTADLVLDALSSASSGGPL